MTIIAGHGVAAGVGCAMPGGSPLVLAQARLYSPRRDLVGRGPARLGVAEHGTVSLGRPRRGGARQDPGSARPGMVRQVSAPLGPSRRGSVRQGQARQGSAPLPPALTACLGLAGHGAAWQAPAGLGSSPLSTLGLARRVAARLVPARQDVTGHRFPGLDRASL